MGYPLSGFKSKQSAVNYLSFEVPMKGLDFERFRGNNF